MNWFLRLFRWIPSLPSGSSEQESAHRAALTLSNQPGVCRIYRFDDAPGYAEQTKEPKPISLLVVVEVDIYLEYVQGAALHLWSTRKGRLERIKALFELTDFELGSDYPIDPWIVPVDWLDAPHALPFPHGLSNARCARIMYSLSSFDTEDRRFLEPA